MVHASLKAVAITTAILTYFAQPSFPQEAPTPGADKDIDAIMLVGGKPVPVPDPEPILEPPPVVVAETKTQQVKPPFFSKAAHPKICKATSWTMRKARKGAIWISPFVSLASMVIGAM